MSISMSGQTGPAGSFGVRDRSALSSLFFSGPDPLGHPQSHEFHAPYDGTTITVVFVGSNQYPETAFMAPDLIQGAMWRTLQGAQTGAGHTVNIVCGQTLAVPQAPPADEAKNEAAALLDRIQEDAGLTLEQIAPLVGVSRRSLQAWRAGAPISGRKADRLRAVNETIEALVGADQEETKATLFSRAPGGVSIYGLLREGRLSTALARAKGQPVSVDDSESEGVLPSAHPLSVRLGLRQDGIAGAAGQLDARRVRRIRRG